MEVELGRPYGEGQDIYATPFVKHIEYSGGGLCAQAACFMASVLLHDFPNTSCRGCVHGVAEVTAIVAPPNENELLLRGLVWKDIVRYFNATGRAARFQRPQMRFGKCRDEAAIRAAIKGYLLSGMPVIHLVNIRLMEAIYKRNGVGVRSRDSSLSKFDHAILLAGYGKRSDRVLINDPATLPFLEATFDELWSAGSLVESDRAGNFIAISPAAVRNSLEDWRDPETGQEYAGLFGCAQLLQQEYEGCDSVPWRRVASKEHGYAVGEWRLGTLDALLESERTPRQMRDALMAAAAELALPRDRWLWIQYWRMPNRFFGRSHTVWIWDAEVHLTGVRWINPKHASSENREQARRALLAVLRRGSSKYTVLSSSLPAVKDEPVGEVLSGATLEDGFSVQPLGVSLISSFSVLGYKAAFEMWPNSAPACELYTFMQKDIAALTIPLRNFNPGLNEKTKAIALMSDLAGNPIAINTIAEHLLVALPHSAAPVIAIASFLPEISSRDERLRRTARDAIVFLVGLCHALQRLQGSNSPSVIELVGGSLIEGIWPCMLTPTKPELTLELSYAANRSSVGVCVDRLIQTLKEAHQEVIRLYGACEAKMALELEPGPLYALNEVAVLESIANRIKDDESLSPIVGFNLDVAHWHLSGIDSAGFQRLPPEVLNRVIHAHISDHGRGHFGDSVVGDCGLGCALNGLGRTKPFRNWLTEIIRLGTASRLVQYPPFSGFVSIELEACTRPAETHRCVERVRTLLEAP